VAFPNSFIRKDFNCTEPWIEYSFFIKNKHFFVLERFHVTAVIRVSFYQDGTDDLVQEKIFEQRLLYKVLPKQSLAVEINATSENFDKDKLILFWNIANLTKEYTFLIDIDFEGLYIYGLIRFSFRYYDVDIEEYEFP